MTTTANATTLHRGEAASGNQARSTAAATAPASGFFKPATEAPSFLKMGIYGDPGSGKTYTASQIAAGLARRIGNAPVLFLDTEGGSVWVRPIFEKAGVPFLVNRSRAYKDAKAAVAEAERLGGILIIDSITHFWEEIREAYLKAKRERTRNPNARLELPDWNHIKPEWGRFTALFLNSQCHIVLCGRGASVYEFIDREDDPTKKDMIASGTRMAAEKGLGYEPSLLIEMAQKQTTAAGKRKSITRIATVLKDRSDVLDGQRFEDPGFEDFLPHIEYLNVGGGTSRTGYVAFDESRTSEGMFPTEGAGRDAYAARRLVVLDDTKDLLLKHIPGQTQADKVRKMELMRRHFGCGWVEAEELAPLERLKAGYARLKAELEPATQPVAQPMSEIVGDEIPHMEPKTPAAGAAESAKPAPAPTAAPAAPASGLAADLEGSTVVLLEKAMARMPNETRVATVWKDYEGVFKGMSPEGQARMLAAKEAAIERCAAAKTRLRNGAANGAGRAAALAEADAEAAREAAQ
jgi:hypothetical protein